MAAPRRIGMLIFPRLTQLDMTGPYEVLARLPNTTVDLVARTRDPVTTDRGMQIVPTVTNADCPPLDVVMVPGGPGQQDLMEDEAALEFLRKQAASARYVTSVCTGSLVLGAAGLLRGYRAATHWSAVDFLAGFGAIPARTRVCVDRNRITGGGVTAGIDFALTLVSIMVDRETAETIQLGLEYNPAPPFDAGSPDRAPPDILARAKARTAPMQARRSEAMQRAAARLA